MKANNKKFLSQYKKELYQAYKHNYTYTMPRSILQKMEEIWFDETGSNLNTNFACGNCILKLLSQCGRLYFTQYPDEEPKN